MAKAKSRPVNIQPAVQILSSATLVPNTLVPQVEIAQGSKPAPCILRAGEVQCGSYTRKIFHPDRFRTLVHEAAEYVQKLQKKHPEIQALAACGHSGAMLMGALSYELGLPQIAVRKELSFSHDGNMVNGWLGCEGYLIVDDLISSGNTICHIVKHIWLETKRMACTSQPKLIAALLYHSSSCGHRTFTLDTKNMPSGSAGYNFVAYEMGKPVTLPVYGVGPWNRCQLDDKSP
jgi:hypothetical protein